MALFMSNEGYETVSARCLPVKVTMVVVSNSCRGTKKNNLFWRDINRVVECASIDRLCW